MVEESNSASQTSGSNTATLPPEAQNLESYLADSGSMSWRESLMHIHDVCFELERQNVVYGDLTIRSISVNKGTAGSASLTLRHQIKIEVQKPSKEKSASFPDEAYFSPEKCLNKSLDRRADVYSLGCILYQMMTGAPPFAHRDAEKLKEAHAADYALPPGRRSQKHYIPDEVDALVLTCLAKDPAKRFKNAGELRANIGKALQLEEDPEDAIKKSAKFSEFFKRRRQVFIGVFGILVVTVVLGLLTLSTTSSEDFHKLIQRTAERHRNRWFLNLEHAEMFTAQAEFENGKMVPDKGKEPIELKAKNADIIMFATTKRKTVREAVEEAIRRKLILFAVDLRGADLTGLKLNGGTFEQATFANANLKGATINGCDLKESDFTQANLKGVNLGSNSMEQAIFRQANAEGADFSRSFLSFSDFQNANLKGADFSNAHLTNADFTGADLTGATMTGAKLTDVCLKTANLTPAQRQAVTVITGPTGPREVVRPLGVAEPKGMDVQLQQREQLKAPPVSNFGFNVPNNQNIGLDIKLDKNGNPLTAGDPPPLKRSTAPGTQAAPINPTNGAR